MSDHSHDTIAFFFFFFLPQLVPLSAGRKIPFLPTIVLPRQHYTKALSDLYSVLLPENSSPKDLCQNNTFKNLISPLSSRQTVEAHQDAVEKQRAEWMCVFLWKLLLLPLSADPLLLSIAFPWRLLSEWQTSEGTRCIWKEQKLPENPEGPFHCCREVPSRSQKETSEHPNRSALWGFQTKQGFPLSKGTFFQLTLIASGPNSMQHSNRVPELYVWIGSPTEVRGTTAVIQFKQSWLCETWIWLALQRTILVGFETKLTFWDWSHTLKLKFCIFGGLKMCICKWNFKFQQANEGNCGKGVLNWLVSLVQMARTVFLLVAFS